jgi:hypothetical protein
MNIFCNMLKLPSPRDLGWSDHNALGSRKLTPFQEGKTWEDWTEYVKAKYPVRYFLIETLPNIIRPLGWKLGRMWYWLKCHILPSYKFHLVDLRGVDPLSSYTHGYNDPCAVMYLTAWKALRDYIEKEKPTDPTKVFPLEKLQQDYIIEQNNKKYYEPHALYKYWMEERLLEEKEENRLFKLCEDCAISEEAYQKASDEWIAYHKARQEREQEMFMKLCSIREYLWT